MSNPQSRKLQRGQAMLEYSVLNFVLIVGLCMATQVKMLPGAAGTHGQTGKVNIMEAFLASYQTYYDSFYFVLNMPFP